jgi:Ca-activated chloride channel homolog
MFFLFHTGTLCDVQHFGTELVKLCTEFDWPFGARTAQAPQIHDHNKQQRSQSMKPIHRSHQRPSPLALMPLIAIALLLLTMAIAKPARAAGLLIADGGFGGVLEIKAHDVKVTINNGIAVTNVTQVFHNTENRQVEALYTFPVPKHASVSNFSMWINGKEVVGEVLEKERAREIYNSYKQRRKDPGLLEQVDYKRFEMRIFPIAANADQRVQITYYQELDIDHDEVTYVYPLATATRGKIDSTTSGRFAFQLETKSAIPITRLESPSHGSEVVIADHSDNYKLASLEQKNGSLAADIVIHYKLNRPRSGIDLITSRTSNEDGFFYLTIMAGKELTKHDFGMDYIFLLDISGSMANSSKLPISRRSLAAFINELDDKDRFEVMTFNVQPNMVFNQLRDASAQTKSEAEAFLDTQAARGGTILAPALTTAYKYGDPDRQLNVIILSDGMTEQKERQTLIDLIGRRPDNARVFCIGIGNEINRPLLQQLAEDSGGLAAFVSGGDDFKRQAKAFRRKLMRPAAGNLSLQFDGIEAYDLAPAKLPNLYFGSPIRVYGRYKGVGDARVTLKGQVQGREFQNSADLPFPKKDATNPEIERMWAQKQIDQLLKEADRRNNRPAVVDEVVQLGEDFSIVTQYTSFLVLENDAEYKRWKIDRRNQRRLQRDRSAQDQRRQALDALRQKAMQGIGPQPLSAKSAPQRTTAMKPVTPIRLQPPRTPQQPAVSPQADRRQSRDFDFSFGSGPVGPLFVGLALWMKRRKKHH